MKWIANQLKNIGAFFSGKAEWLEQQDKAVQDKFSAYNSAVRKTVLAAFIAGVIVGALLQ